MRDIGEDDFDFPDTQGVGAEERKDGDSFMTFEEAEILTAQVAEMELRLQTQALRHQSSFDEQNRINRDALSEIRILRDSVSKNPVLVAPPKPLSKFVLQSEVDEIFEASVPGRTIFPQLKALQYPNEHKNASAYERVLVCLLEKGMILPILRFVGPDGKSSCDAEHISFENLMSPTSLYVVVSSHADQSSELVLLSSSFHGASEKVAFEPFEKEYSVLVLSPVTINTRLPPTATKVLSSLHIVPMAPSQLRQSSLKRSFNSVAAGGVSSELSRGAEVREVTAAPFLRAIHNNSVLFNVLVGPLGDVTSGQFFCNLRNHNSNARAGLLTLPILNADHHQQFFLGFRWDIEPHLSSVGSGKKLDGCHLSLLMPQTGGYFHVFKSYVDIVSAIKNLQDICVCLFGENPKSSTAFFSIIFKSLIDALDSTDPKESLHELTGNFLVWKVSELLVKWSRLYSSASLAQAPMHMFFTANVEALAFNPTDWLDQSTRVCRRYVPVQVVIPPVVVSKNPSQQSSATTGVQKKRKQPLSGVKSVAEPNKKSKSYSSSVSTVPSGSDSKSSKYICLTDFLTKQNPSKFPPCGKKHCNLLHMEKPSKGGLSDMHRAELIASSTKLRGGQQASEINAFIAAIA